MNEFIGIITDILDCSGKAIKKKNSKSIVIETMEFDMVSKKHILDIIKKGINRDNQSVTIDTLVISKDDYLEFIDGQSRTLKKGDQIVVTSDPVTYLKYKCELQLLINDNNGLSWAAKLIIPSIDFRIADSTPIFDDDIVVFDNVEAMIYEKCILQILDDDGER